MTKELLETGADMQDTPEVSAYQAYEKSGGIINEKDYNSAMSRLEITDEDAETPDKQQVSQAVNMAKHLGINLSPSDKRVRLYSILRSDARPVGQKYHHQNMSDPQIFVEALRMLGDEASVEKMIEKYGSDPFTYKK